MAHLIKKIKKGRPYYYIREMARVDGKPRVVSQVYLGTLERILEMATGAKEKPLKVSCQEFGALWLANLVEQQIGAASIIDSVIPRSKTEKGPSIGEYFLYAVLNRMIDSCSKRSLSDWYKSTAVQHIRPVDIDELSSQRYWEKWDRVKEDDLRKIASLFFEKISALEAPGSDCFLFDTTNYFTFMASDTDSQLAKRGKNKEGRNWLRQIGVALLMSRKTELPLFYREYEGNRHDSKLFSRILAEVLEAARNHAGEDAELTIVFDKGMNSEGNITAIDGTPGAHFITSYSCHYADELTRVKLSKFSPVDTAKNRELARLGREDDCLVAYRSGGEYWGRERTVVVTHNPLTAAKQRYAFEKKLLDLQETLSFIRGKVSAQAWKDPERIMKHYRDACERLHLPKDLFDVLVEEEKGRRKFLFHKNHYRIGKYIEKFGRNILITDRSDWSTEEIVRASLDRYMVEKAFRQTKDDELVSMQPIYHWTDGKIRCHILTCIIALAYLRILENRLHESGVDLTAPAAINHMKSLHSCLCWTASKSKPSRLLEEPTEIQTNILQAFGHKIEGGVLRPST